MIADELLASLRKKENEEDEAFVERMQRMGHDITMGDMDRWRRLTKDGTVYGGPALRQRA